MAKGISVKLWAHERILDSVQLRGKMLYVRRCHYSSNVKDQMDNAVFSFFFSIASRRQGEKKRVPRSTKHLNQGSGSGQLGQALPHSWVG